MTGEVPQEKLDFPLTVAQVLAAFHLMKLDVTSNPVGVGTLGVQGIMLQPHDLLHLVQKFELGIGNDELTGRPPAAVMPRPFP